MQEPTTTPLPTDYLDNGKPAARRGRKATGLLKAAGLPTVYPMNLTALATAARPSGSTSAPTAPVARAGQDAAESGPATRVEISEEARARAAEAAEVDESQKGHRVSDPKHKQVLWSDKLWSTHPSGTSGQDEPKKPTPVRLRPLGQSAVKEQAKTTKTAHSDAAHTYEVRQDARQAHEDKPSVREADEAAFELPGRAPDKDTDEAKEAQESTPSFGQRRFARAHKMVASLLP